MPNCCTRLAPRIKRRDLFGVPVQLTYNGQVAFNTVCGGIVSILFMLLFAIGFAYQLYFHIMEPQFMNYPPHIDYSESSAQLNMKTGTTLAFAVNKF